MSERRAAIIFLVSRARRLWSRRQGVRAAPSAAESKKFYRRGPRTGAGANSFACRCRVNQPCASVLCGFFWLAAGFRNRLRGARAGGARPCEFGFLWTAKSKLSGGQLGTGHAWPMNTSVKGSVSHVSPPTRTAAGVAAARVHLAQRLASTHCQTPGPCAPSGCPGSAKPWSVNPRRHRAVR